MFNLFLQLALNSSISRLFTSTIKIRPEPVSMNGTNNVTGTVGLSGDSSMTFSKEKVPRNS